MAANDGQKNRVPGVSFVRVPWAVGDAKGWRGDERTGIAL